MTLKSWTLVSSIPIMLPSEVIIYLVTFQWTSTFGSPRSFLIGEVGPREGSGWWGPWMLSSNRPETRCDSAALALWPWANVLALEPQFYHSSYLVRITRQNERRHLRWSAELLGDSFCSRNGHLQQPQQEPLEFLAGAAFFPTKPPSSNSLCLPRRADLHAWALFSKLSCWWMETPVLHLRVSPKGPPALRGEREAHKERKHCTELMQALQIQDGLSFALVL